MSAPVQSTYEAEGNTQPDPASLQQRVRNLAEQQLQASEKRWEFVFRSSPVPGLISDTTTGEILAANEEFLNWVGLPTDKVVGFTTIDTGIWSSYEEREKVIGLACDQGRLRNHEVQHVVQGELRTALINMEHIELGGRACLFTKYIDITDRKKLENALLLAATAIEQAAEAIVLLNQHGQIIQVNPAFSATTGYSLEEAMNQPFDELLNIPSGRHVRGLFSALTHNLHTGTPWKGELWAKRKNGSIFPQLLSISAIQNPHGQAQNYIVVFSDHSDRKRYEEELKHRAMHDSLTGLPNRALLHEHLDHAVSLAQRQHSTLAVLFTDLDEFKQVNDSHGHDTGDALLRQVAARLRVCVRDSDLVARLGGDEFVVVLQGLSCGTDAQTIAGKIINQLSQPFYVGGKKLCVGISVGIALFPKHGVTSDTLLRCADQALYKAKNLGRGAHVVWYPALSKGSQSDKSAAAETDS
jgi:diguanylate cyclase (GGDEF)-like protein/PAS domain S-box-containing protein